jgi:hypothetical protein
LVQFGEDFKRLQRVLARQLLWNPFGRITGVFDASLETSVKLVQQNKWTGGIQRDFTTPEKNLLRAYELDPRYVGTIARLIVWYDSNRQYDKKSKIIDQALAAGVQ